MKFSSKKSRNIFCPTLLFCSLALTGCAVGRYHDLRPITEAYGEVLPISKPVHGSVVIGFGELFRGVGLKGAWMKADPGEFVVASADGRVQFSDEHLEGYGQAVLVEHAGQLWTVYAGMAKIFVHSGEYVRRGQPLGKMGSGDPQLYFEFRRGLKAEDPVRIWA